MVGFRWDRWLCQGGMAVYRYFLSPMLHVWFGPGGGCRFEPSCSRYLEEAVDRWGWRGFGLGIKRLMRCHPWGKQKRGDFLDPVPPRY